jgi:hypothetical protein
MSHIKIPLERKERLTTQTNGVNLQIYLATTSGKRIVFLSFRRHRQSTTTGAVPDPGGVWVLTNGILTATSQPNRTIAAKPASHSPRMKLAGL